jgi:hypothetical protein
MNSPLCEFSNGLYEDLSEQMGVETIPKFEKLDLPIMILHEGDYVVVNV